MESNCFCKVKKKCQHGREGCQNIGKKCRNLLWMVPLFIFLMIPGIFRLCMGVNDKNPMETKIDFIKILNSELQLLKVKFKLTKHDGYYGFSVHCQA